MSIDLAVSRQDVGFYPPAMFLPYQFVIANKVAGLIQLPTAITDDPIRLVVIPSALLGVVLTLRLLPLRLTETASTPSFGTRPFNYTMGYSESFMNTTVTMAQIVAASTSPDRRRQEIKWLEPSADYVPPTMNLFSDSSDKIPLGSRPSLFCPKDSEHVERAYDLLWYRHAAKTLGVPSVTSRDSLPPRPIGSRVLGNTASPFFSPDGYFESRSPLCVLDPLVDSSTCDSVTYATARDLTPPGGKRPIFVWFINFLLFIFGLFLGMQFQLDWLDFGSTKSDGMNALIAFCSSSIRAVIASFCQTGSKVGWNNRTLLTVLDILGLERDCLDQLPPAEVLLRNTVDYLLRFIIFGTAMIACFCLRVVALVMTRRFGHRSLARLIGRYHGSKTSRKKRNTKITPMSPSVFDFYLYVGGLYIDYSTLDLLDCPPDYVVVQFVETPGERVIDLAPAGSEPNGPVWYDFELILRSGLDLHFLCPNTTISPNTFVRKVEISPRVESAGPSSQSSGAQSTARHLGKKTRKNSRRKN